MPDVTEIERLWKRVCYFAEKAGEKSGRHYRVDSVGEDGQPYFFECFGAKNPEDIEHEVRAWCVFLWSYKDYLKRVAIDSGKEPGWVVAQVRQTKKLKIVADLANREKHGVASFREKIKHDPWTDFEPRFGRVSQVTPQAAIKVFGIGKGASALVVDKPELVEYEFPVLDNQGTEIGSAFTILCGAMDEWEEIRARLFSQTSEETQK